MHSQVDEDGCNTQMLDDVVDHRKDVNAVDRSGMQFRTKSGKQRLRRATSGWSLLILWNNGEEE